MKKSRRKRDSNPGSSALKADALTTRPTRRTPAGFAGLSPLDLDLDIYIAEANQWLKRDGCQLVAVPALSVKSIVGTRRFCLFVCFSLFVCLFFHNHVLAGNILYFIFDHVVARRDATASALRHLTEYRPFEASRLCSLFV